MAIETIGEDTSTSNGTAVTSSASADTYGSYSELSASTGQTCEILTINIIQATAGAARSSIIEIATGAASSEVALFEVMLPGTGIAFGNVLHMAIPITIASGTRIAARSKSALGSTTLRMTASISDDDSWGTGSEAELIGISNSEGTAIDPGGTANTKGSWVEISSSTSHDYDWIWLFVGHNNNTVAAAARWLIDIGTGAAASETVLVPDTLHALSLFESPPACVPLIAPISSGARVAVRAQCSITDATDRIIDVTILGANLTAPSGGGGSATTASGFMV